MGGFGGDWDTLEPTARYADDAQLERQLAALGYAGDPPLGAHHTLQGFFVVHGVRVPPSVDRKADANTLTVTAAVYVTDEDVYRAAHLERWFDARGLQMTPRAAVG